MAANFKLQNGGHFGGQKAKWWIWRTEWLYGGHPPEWRTLDTYGQGMMAAVHIHAAAVRPCQCIKYIASK